MELIWLRPNFIAHEFYRNKTFNLRLNQSYTAYQLLWFYFFFAEDLWRINSEISGGFRSVEANETKIPTSWEYFDGGWFEAEDLTITGKIKWYIIATIRNCMFLEGNFLKSMPCVTA